MAKKEEAMAAASRRYVEEVVLPQGLSYGRKQLVASLDTLYADRLRLPAPRARVDAIRAALEEEAPALVEVAHDGQLPHLGIVRLVLKARELSLLAGPGLALYLVGDHYSAEMRPENLYLGLPLRGIDADRVKNPLVVSVGRRNRHVPFRCLPPPSEEALDELERRAQAWIENNAAAAGGEDTTPKLRSKVDEQFDIMRESSRLTRSFGDWLIRLQVVLLDALHGGPPEGLAILPMSGIVQWLPDVLRELAAQDDMVLATKTHISKQQLAHGEIPYSSGGGGAGSFWVYCPSCYRRYRGKADGASLLARCPACDIDVTARWPEDVDRIMPDIVAYELALFRMGIAGWIVGSRAPYHPVIERCYTEIYGDDVPPRFFLSSVPRFHGLGEPEQGHTRARLLRVLLEVEPRRLQALLTAPWDENPLVQSPLIPRSFPLHKEA